MRKFIAFAGSLAVAAAAFTLPASAQTISGAAQNQMAVIITPSGQAHVEGQVTAVSSSIVSLLSWDGTWTVNLTGNGTSTLGNLKVGDTVIANGKVSSAGSLNLNANVLRNVSEKEHSTSTEARLHRTVVGTVSALDQNARTFVLSLKNGKTVNVSVNADASVRVKGASTSTLANLQNGERVAVSGNLNQSTNTIVASRITLLGKALGILKNAVHKLNGILKMHN